MHKVISANEYPMDWEIRYCGSGDRQYQRIGMMPIDAAT